MKDKYTVLWDNIEPLEEWLRTQPTEKWKEEWEQNGVLVKVSEGCEYFFATEGNKAHLNYFCSSFEDNHFCKCLFPFDIFT